MPEAPPTVAPPVAPPANPAGGARSAFALPSGLAARWDDAGLTTGGVCFLLATAGIGLAAMSTGNNLAYLFFSMMLATLVVSLGVGAFSLHGLRVERIAPRNVAAGERFAITLNLSNRRRFFSSYSIRAVDRMDDDAPLGACYALRVPPRERVESSYLAAFSRRGLRRLDSVQLTSSFPFGFRRRTRRLRLPGETLVWPAVLPVRAWSAYSPVSLGDSERPRRGMGADFYGLREYREGDDARLIHWKASARLSRLITRETEEEEKRRVTLLLDNGVPAPGDAEVAVWFERAVVACASMASAYLDRGYELQIITRSGQVPMSVGANHLQRVLRSLALIELTEWDGPPLWIPPPAGQEAQIAIEFATPPRRPPSAAVHLLVVRDTPPFAEFAPPA